MGKKITERNRVLAGALLCGIIALAGCGGEEACKNDDPGTQGEERPGDALGTG